MTFAPSAACAASIDLMYSMPASSSSSVQFFSELLWQSSRQPASLASPPKSGVHPSAVAALP
jgi:hypothetical protein